MEQHNNVCEAGFRLCCAQLGACIWVVRRGCTDPPEASYTGSTWQHSLFMKRRAWQLALYVGEIKVHDEVFYRSSDLTNANRKSAASLGVSCKEMGLCQAV